MNMPRKQTTKFPYAKFQKLSSPSFIILFRIQTELASTYGTDPDEVVHYELPHWIFTVPKSLNSSHKHSIVNQISFENYTVEFLYL